MVASADIKGAEGLNKAAKAVFKKCWNLLRNREIVSLKAKYLVSRDLLMVDLERDKYGAEALDVLTVGLGLNARTQQRYLSVARAIDVDEFKMIEDSIAESQTVFTFTHMVILAGVPDRVQRQKFFEAWKESQLPVRDFQTTINDALQVDSPGESANAAASAKEVTDIDRLRKAVAVIKKVIVAVDDLEDLNFVTLPDLLPKAGAFIEQLREEVGTLTSSLDLLADRMNAGLFDDSESDLEAEVVATREASDELPEDELSDVDLGALAGFGQLPVPVEEPEVVSPAVLKKPKKVSKEELAEEPIPSSDAPKPRRGRPPKKDKDPEVAVAVSEELPVAEGKVKRRGGQPKVQVDEKHTVMQLSRSKAGEFSGELVGTGFATPQLVGEPAVVSGPASRRRRSGQAAPA